jgi:hypothetical protein
VVFDHLRKYLLCYLAEYDDSVSPCSSIINAHFNFRYSLVPAKAILPTETLLPEVEEVVLLELRRFELAGMKLPKFGPYRCASQNDYR